MSDNKNIRDGRDRSKVDLHDRNEVEYLKSKFPYESRENIEEAIRSAGPGREQIETYLRKREERRGPK